MLHQYRQHEWRLSATDLIAAAETSLKQTPFSPQQREQLAAVLTQQYGAQPGTGRGIDPVPYRITADEHLIRMIQTIATPEQVAPFLRFKALQETPSSHSPGTRK